MSAQKSNRGPNTGFGSMNGSDLSHILKSQVPLPRTEFRRDLQQDKYEKSVSKGKELWKKMEKQKVDNDTQPEIFYDKSIKQYQQPVDIDSFCEFQNKERQYGESTEDYFKRLQQKLDYSHEMLFGRFNYDPNTQHWKNADSIRDKQQTPQSRNINQTPRNNSVMTYYQLRQFYSRNNTSRQNKSNSIILGNESLLKVTGRDLKLNEILMRGKRARSNLKQKVSERNPLNIMTHLNNTMINRQSSKETGISLSKQSSFTSKVSQLYQTQYKMGVGKQSQFGITPQRTIRKQQQQQPPQSNMSNTFSLMFKVADDNETEQKGRNILLQKLNNNNISSFNQSSNQDLQPVTQKIQPQYNLSNFQKQLSSIRRRQIFNSQHDNNNYQVNMEKKIVYQATQKQNERAISTQSKRVDHSFIDTQNHSLFNDTFTNMMKNPQIKVDFQKSHRDGGNEFTTTADNDVRIEENSYKAAHIRQPGSNALNSNVYENYSSLQQRIKQSTQRFPNLRHLIDKLESKKSQLDIFAESFEIENEKRYSMKQPRPNISQISLEKNDISPDTNQSRANISRVLIQQRIKKQRQLQSLMKIQKFHTRHMSNDNLYQTTSSNGGNSFRKQLNDRRQTTQVNVKLLQTQTSNLDLGNNRERNSQKSQLSRLSRDKTRSLAKIISPNEDIVTPLEFQKSISVNIEIKRKVKEENSMAKNHSNNRSVTRIKEITIPLLEKNLF